MRVRIVLPLSVLCLSLSVALWMTARISAQTLTPTPSPTPPVIVFSANGQPSEMYSDLYGVYRLYLNSDFNHPLTDRDRHYLQPRWSPDGTRIVYTVTQVDENAGFNNTFAGSAIEIMDADGSNVQALTAGNGEYAPTWSPDGATIAYASVVDNGIYLMDADGENQRLIYEGVEVKSLDFSPDGDELLVAARLEENGLTQPYILNLEDMTLRPLLEDDISVWDAAWSPDGATIALATTMDGIVLFDMTVQTTEPVTFTGFWTFALEDAFNVSDLAWSPDGTQLAFIIQSWRLEVAISTPVPIDRVGAQLAVVDLATGNLDILTYGFSNADPDWRP